MPRYRYSLPILFCLLAATIPAAAGEPSPALLRITVGNATYEGKAVASNDRQFWLMSRDGQLKMLQFDRIAAFEKVPGQFRSDSVVDMRDELKAEYGGDFEITAKGHYVVCAPRGRAREYAQLLDGIYHRFLSYFRVRQLKVSEPEFPLVALIFPDHTGFARYAAGDRIRALPGLMGYYHHHTNRMALFDPGDGVAANQLQPSALGTLAGFPQPEAPYAKLTGAFSANTGAPDSGLRDTMIHEATHQIAFNTGLHSRIGDDPKWIVEGLATVYEAPGIREGSGLSKTADQINRDRFVWFMNFAETRRRKGDLRRFIASDDAFNAALLDGYSQAWALSFYLIQTRSSAFAGYLNTVAHRDPLKPYGADERLKDFQDAFGNNLDVLDASFLKFMKNLSASLDHR